MSKSTPLEETDRLLNELEDLASSNASNAVFFDRLLTSLQMLVRAESAAIIMPIAANQFGIIAKVGNLPSDAMERWEAKLGNPGNEHFSLNDMITVPIQSESSETGCLYVGFPKPLPESACQGLIPVVEAFAEILQIRQIHRVERLIHEHWTLVRLLLNQLPNTLSQQQAAGLLSDRLSHLFSAARVSVISRTSAALPRVLAVSSLPDFDKNSDSIRGLQGVCLRVFENRTPLIRESANSRVDTDIAAPNRLEDGTFENLLGIRLSDSLGSSSTTALVVEWSTRKEMLESISSVQHFLPSIDAVWHSHMRWLAMPRFTRGLGRLYATLGSSIRSNLVKTVAFLAFLFCVYYLLMLPTALTIEADSILEPLAKNVVFASADGFVEEIFVKDGQSVKKGERLVQLTSPQLASQIEETAGNLRALVEKRNGLRVAMNQLKSSSPDSEMSQNRMAADILMLDVQEKHAQEKFRYLGEEKERLLLIAPLDGIVVAKDLHRELTGRPLRRGDALFQIVDLDGEWQLRVLVADRDAGFVTRFYPGSQTKVSFQFDSLPGELFDGMVSFVSSSVENLPGKASVLPLFVQIDKTAATQASMGANARVYFKCGSQPLWYVWCRPIVEAIQHSVWLFDFRTNSASSGAS